MLGCGTDMAKLKSILGLGVYGLPEAARLARVHTSTARRWYVGGSGHTALLSASIPRVNGRTAISFLDLVDLLVVGQFRSAGVSFQTIRRAYGILQRRFDTAHAFSHRFLLTDGHTILVEYMNELGDDHLEDVITGQRAMPEILREYLKEIDYDDATNLAKQWHVASGVLIDPRRNFGKPIVPSGVSTSVIYSSAKGNNNDYELVADLFGISAESVRDAVIFEQELAA